MRRSRLLALAILLLLPSCSPPKVAPVPNKSGFDFLLGSLFPWPSDAAPTRLVRVNPTSSRVAIYDNALVSLVLDRFGHHELAGRILGSLARLQRSDGAIPFSFDLAESSDPPPYVRSGALAWVGYAATDYLDAERGGEGRDEITRMAHRIAAYLLRHQVHAAGDFRDGLITGGEGDLSYDVSATGPEERLVPVEIGWASIEHNIDAFFFLRALARTTEQVEYSEAAALIARALLARSWDEKAGQLRGGLEAHAVDDVLPLDSASWGAVFLIAAGDRVRAERALTTALTDFASRDPRTGARGHKPYAQGEILADASLAAFYASSPGHNSWVSVSAVWPEGSAGVALAAVRLGQRERAIAILAELERLREPSGALPMMTMEVPFAFDTRPSIAATAWVELMREEAKSDEAEASLWRP